MAFRKMPMPDVMPLTDLGHWTPDYFDFFKGLDNLDELSKIVFPASVTSIDTASGAFTLGYGLSRLVQSLRLGLTSITASLGADVALNNVANYFDGPSVAQGAVGTWMVNGTVTVTDTASAANHNAKLWDGTTVIASCAFTSLNTGRNIAVLSGLITNPAGNLRISVQDTTSTNGTTFSAVQQLSGEQALEVDALA